ncbi:hypothetical protein ZWY2020_052098 [Hordeum vulgare]|nr:hypothetical protein ZWY2020_052098 [Hordeum vulgare]
MEINTMTREVALSTMSRSWANPCARLTDSTPVRTGPIWSFPDGGEPELTLPVLNLVYEAGRCQLVHLAAQQPPLPPPSKTEQRV